MDNAIGKAIQVIRKKHHLSQAAFASRIGSSAEHISRVENGRHVARNLLLDSIIKEFDLSKTYFEDLLNPPVFKVPNLLADVMDSLKTPEDVTSVEVILRMKDGTTVSRIFDQSFLTEVPII